MSIDNATIKTGATTVAATGGDDQILSKVSGENGITVVFDGDSVFASRRTVHFRYTDPPISGSSATGYGKAKRTFTLRYPEEVSTGVFEPIIVDVSIRSNSTTTAAIMQAVRNVVAQLIIDTEFDDFYELGDIS